MKRACQRAGGGVLYTVMADLNGTQTNNQPVTIFVVDDEPMLLEMAVMILEPLHFLVRTFRDAQTALAEYTTADPRPALIVTDYAMHSMTGIDLIRECRRIHPKQKIILVSGSVDESICNKVEARPDRFLAKPYQVSDFVALIQSLATG
jgi:two-component system cell cycle sensor histidine kinase/response regulator CckA